MSDCPYCGQCRNRSECLKTNMAKGVLPSCACGPRDDAPEQEKRAFRQWIASHE